MEAIPCCFGKKHSKDLSFPMQIFDNGISDCIDCKDYRITLSILACGFVHFAALYSNQVWILLVFSFIG